MDAYSRRILGWSFRDNLETELVASALRMALGRRRNLTGELIHHSDRGVQYASGPYRALLAQAGLTASMSRKANCYDNAMMESFWSTLKADSVSRTCFPTRSQAQVAIFEYIETFYNPRRSHSSLGYISPIAFEALNN